MLVLFLAAVSLMWLIGSRNPFTPAGYVGYLTKGAVVGKSRFYGIQKGPTSAGRTWLLDVTNISVTPYTYTEEFTGNQAVLSRDNLKISFAIHTVWRVDETKIPLFMERFSTTVTNGDTEKSPDAVVRVAYGNYVREPLRTFARDEVQRRAGLAVKDELIPIGQAVLGRIQALRGGEPVHHQQRGRRQRAISRTRSPMRSPASSRRRRSWNGRTPRSRSSGKSGPSGRCRRPVSPTPCRSSAAS